MLCLINLGISHIVTIFVGCLHRMVRQPTFDNLNCVNMSLTDVFKKIFGSKADRDMKAIKPTLDKVLAAYKGIDALTDDELRARCQALKDKIQAAIAADEARIAEIKAELEKEIPLSQKEKLATESDKLVKKVDETIEKVLDEILPEAFAIMKSTARRFKENETIKVVATDFDRDLSTTKEFVTIDGDYAIWQNHWMAGGNEMTWDMVHYDVQLIGGIVLNDNGNGKAWRGCEIRSFVLCRKRRGNMELAWS